MSDQEMLSGTNRATEEIQEPKRSFDLPHEARDVLPGHEMHPETNRATKVSEEPHGPKSFFDLPREVRDMIYLYFPGTYWIDLMQMPLLVLQPRTSLVCNQMRRESLESFYSRKTYFIDLRGWKSPVYPKRWTPRTVCKRWVDAIGDENAGFLRSISFYSHNFIATVKIESTQPGITLRFRAKAGFKVDTVEGVSQKYTFQLAAERARERVEKAFARMAAERAGGTLKVDDIEQMCEMFEMLQPFLCRRNSLGYGGAVFPEDAGDWPDAQSHCETCDDCGYHRITRGND